MSKTVELRRDIQQLLKSYYEKVFYRRSDSEEEYPYLVYTIEDIFQAKVLNIDIWSQGSNTEEVETIADIIEKIDKEVITNENHALILYYNEDRKWVDDEDKNIQHINLSFEIRYYGKE